MDKINIIDIIKTLFILTIWIAVVAFLPEKNTIKIILTVWFIFSVVIFFYWEAISPENKRNRYILFRKPTKFEDFVTVSVGLCCLFILTEGIERWIFWFVPDFMDEVKGYLSLFLALAVTFYLGKIQKNASNYEANQNEKRRYV